MTARSNFNKKLIYIVVIIVLFTAMFPYSSWLAEEKKRRDLGEAAIGQIDTGSFMMKLFLLGGFRGIVADLLWLRAEDNKRDHDWDRLKTTVELITKLQPHFLSIWTFQGWNLAYNVSVEWDAPEDKYVWIKEGIKFVQQGVNKNRRSPDLVWDTAWFYYHKLGFSDESIILRRLFRDDEEEEFKTYFDPELNQTVVGDDNFKLGYGWFSRAVGLVDAGASRLTPGVGYVDPTPQRKGRPDDIAFRSMPAHGQTRYAAAVEKMSTYGVEARFGEFAMNEWSRALSQWSHFGEHEFDSHNEMNYGGRIMRDKVRLDDSTDTERFNKLNENQKYWTARWADQMNYRYWKARSEAERTLNGVTARRLFYEGTKAYKLADFPQAAQKLRQGLEVWKNLMEEFPAYRDDELAKKDTGLIVKRYVRVLRQLEQPVPESFPFKELLVAAQNDNTVDPFDVMEVIGVVGEGGQPSRTAPAPAGPIRVAPGSAPSAPSR
jgi:hypothetical protein